MTVAQAIARTDRLKPNAYSRADKESWLNKFEGMLKTELLDKYEETYITRDIEGEEADRRLFIEEPYDDVYIHYLSACIDYSNGEYERFNNSNAMYEAAYSAFRNAYNAKHRHIQHKKSYF